MTPAEFKAWFEGFSEGMKDIPTKEQWKRIKQRVSQIDGTPLTREVIHRYWPWYHNTPLYGVYGCTTQLAASSIGSDETAAYATLTNVGRNEATLLAQREG